MSHKVERGGWTAKDDSRHEAIVISFRSGPVAVSFDSPEEAEQVAHDLLRFAAEWKQEIAKQRSSGANPVPITR